MMPKLVKAKPLTSVRGWLLCEFDNQEKRFVDVESFLEGEKKVLTNPRLFKQFHVNETDGVIVWPHKLRIDSHTLYNRGIRINNIRNLNEVIMSEAGMESIILIPVAKTPAAREGAH